MKKIILYKTIDGKCPFEKWESKLDSQVQKRIHKRLQRVLNGNYGDFKWIDEDIAELRFTIGKGYRIYYSEMDDVIILLLSGGDKTDQSQDIKKAKEYFKDYIERNKYD
jgi:putative addiction module killer protein